jgi:hypothetical protein
MAFRWGGSVRQVSRVLNHEVIPNLQARFPEIPSGVDEVSDQTLIAYSLGPDIPTPDIDTKGTYSSGRVWCLLDQLLTHDNLSEACRASYVLVPEGPGA